MMPSPRDVCPQSTACRREEATQQSSTDGDSDDGLPTLAVVVIRRGNRAPAHSADVPEGLQNLPGCTASPFAGRATVRASPHRIADCDLDNAVVGPHDAVYSPRARRFVGLF
jgi:hypothetical protein